MSSSSAESKMALAKTVFSTIGSIAATVMLVRTIVHDYIPPELHEYLFFGLKNMFIKFSNQLTMVIDEFDGLVNNEIYEAVAIYLGNKLSPNIRRLKISKPLKGDIQGIGEKASAIGRSFEEQERTTYSSGDLQVLHFLW